MVTALVTADPGNARKGVKKSLEVDVVIGADGANSRVAKDIEAGDYEYAIAFQAGSDLVRPGAPL